MVLTVLGVVSVIGVTFLYMSQTQLRGANTYVYRLQTKYLAEAGINHAKEILGFDKQGVRIDSHDDIWKTAFQGTEVDLDSDGQAESKWFYVEDDQGNGIGRYAVLVKDEAGKININSAGRHNGSGPIEGYSTFEVSLKKFFDNLGLSGEYLTDQILNYRYGEDGKPGARNNDDNNNNAYLEGDLVDNDADGIIDEVGEGIDEPDEFDIDNPKGDDRPFLVIDELKKTEGVSNNIFEDVSRFITVSSKEREINVDGALRQNVNYTKSDNLLKIMLDRGVAGCWQKAANISDSLDKNVVRTTVFKHYNLLETIAGGPAGDWDWVDDHYECNIPGGEGIWSWQNLPFSDGDYYCFIYGIADEPVGDVRIDEVVQKGMQSGDAFIMTENRKVTVENGSFSLSVQNREAFGKTCYFGYIELVPQDSSALLSKEFHGVETVRINEIMVRPKVSIDTTPSSAPGGLWIWQSGLYVNSQPESGQEGEGRWVFTNIPNGYYYLRLLGQEGEFIGDVEVDAKIQQSLRDGDYFTASNTVNVSSNQLVIRIQNNFEDKTCYFKGIIISQQPDTEYLELVNISNDAIDLSGWMIETTGQEAVTAFIPQGTMIPPFSYLVLCVDKDDRAQGVDNNNISFMDTWAMPQSVQLDFFKVLDRDFDFLNDDPSEGDNFLILKDANGKTVDKIEYLSSQVSNYSSLERADPTAQEDNNNNSEFDGWYATSDLSLGTPARVNNNEGMKKDAFSNHDISEVGIKNYPASNILDLIYVPRSSKWKKINIEDISLMVDSLTVFGRVLYPKENNISGWTEIYGGSEGFYSNTKDEVGIWRWENLNNGRFFLSIKGESEEAITVSCRKADDSWQTILQGAIPNAEGLIYSGMINIGEDRLGGTADNTLEIKIKNVSSTNIAHFYFLRLDPVNDLKGRININTAPKEVLLSLPNMDNSTASIIINSRPLGNADGIYKGIGDLFMADVFNNDPDRIDKLSSFSNLITVRSNIFEITARAQVLDQDKVVATQEIRTIIER